MVHLDFLDGPKSKGLKFVVKGALRDIQALQTGGVDGLLIENWKEENRQEFVSNNTATNLTIVLKKLKNHIKIPFGINILSNDYKTSYLLAKSMQGSFIQLDAFVDRVKTDFSYDSNITSKEFVISPNPKKILGWASKNGASNIPLYAFVQPKHSILLEKGKTIEKSTKQAIEGGASAVIVTKATGTAPAISLFKIVKKTAKKTPVGIGSGLNYDNLSEFFPLMDFAIVGSYFKKGGITDNPVDPKRVKRFMNKVKELRDGKR